MEIAACLRCAVHEGFRANAIIFFTITEMALSRMSVREREYRILRATTAWRHCLLT